MKTGTIGTMNRYTISSWLALVLLAVGAAAQTQTNVTTPSPGGTTNAVPYFSGPYTLGSSPISISGSTVGIGTTSPNESLEVAGTSRAFFGDGGGSSRKGLLISGYQSGATSARIESYDYGTSTGIPLILNSVGHGYVGIGITSPGTPLHIFTRMDPTTGQTNCGPESSGCPGSAASGYGVALDAEYGNGQYTWRLEPVDRGSNISLYFQQSRGVANSYFNVVRFGVNQYDTNAFAVFGNTYLGGNVGIGTTTVCCTIITAIRTNQALNS